MSIYPPLFAAASDGEMVSLSGLLVGVVERDTKQGRRWAVADLQRSDGCVGVRFYPTAFDACSPLLKEDAFVTVTGLVDRRDDVPVLCAREVMR